MRRLKEYPEKNPEYTPYHDTYFKTKLESRILNEDANTLDSGHIFWNRENIQKELASLVGDSDGHSYKDGEALIARIPYLQKELEYIEKTHEVNCNAQEAMGKSRPEKWDRQLFVKKMQTLAKYDVALEEKNHLEKLLEKYSAADVVVESSRVLKSGPVGSGIMKDGVLSELDGMRVSKLKDSLIIDDPRAPQFDGFKTSDYLTYIVKPFIQAKELKFAEQKKQGKHTTDKPLTASGVPVPEMPKNCLNLKELARKQQEILDRKIAESESKKVEE